MDIVERLRSKHNDTWPRQIGLDDLNNDDGPEAADEIERLRAALLRVVCADNGCVDTDGHYPCGVHSLSEMWEATKCGCALEARSALEQT